jgi:hypothetical protein
MGGEALQKMIALMLSWMAAGAVMGCLIALMDERV